MIGGWNAAPAFLPLLPKDAAIPGVLVRHAGQLVTKGALLDAVWPQTYVTDTVVKNGIGRLRRLLGDDRKTPRYIETYPRRGYRFIGTVETPAPAGDCSPAARLAGQTAALVPAPPALLVGCEPELARLQERFVRAQGLWRALGETVLLSPSRLGLWREVYWVGPLASPLALTHGPRAGTTVPERHTQRPTPGRSDR